MSLDYSIRAVRKVVVAEGNITHELGIMADEAGIYDAIWRPDEIGIKTASQLIPWLEQGIKTLENNPSYYKEFNPDNGWGDYDVLLRFVKELLSICREFPDGGYQAD